MHDAPVVSQSTNLRAEPALQQQVKLPVSIEIDRSEFHALLEKAMRLGEPRAIREQVLAESDPPAEFIRSALRRKAAAAGAGF